MIIEKPGSVDGHVNEEEISRQVFGEKYNNVYISVPYSEDDMHSIKQEINDRLNMSNEIYKLDVHDVSKAVHRLKHGNFDGEECLNSDHIINGPHLLTVLLTCIFNCMLAHGVTPDSMLAGTMVPIPKGNISILTCADNYRAITLK